MNNDTLAASAYADPFTFATTYPYGSEPRMAVARAQDEAQRIIVIVGTCVCAVGLLVAICLIDNVVLTDEQSLQESEAIVDDDAEKRRLRLAKGGKSGEGKAAIPTL